MNQKMKIFLSVLFTVAFMFSSDLFARGGGGHSSGGFSHSSSSYGRSSGKVTRVHGYTKKNGTYVSAHRRTLRNKTKKDNWSHKGNINPDTGKVGSKED